jgi:Raf kinase inhibitor-like YbhB/YbcL family protein
MQTNQAVTRKETCGPDKNELALSSKRWSGLIPALLLALLVIPLGLDAQPCLEVSSTTFKNNGTLPLSMINTILVNGVNACTPDGRSGGNQSPELSWTGAPPDTHSFVVIAYDVTAAFTHWGMYNIPPSATGLTENAGVAGSAFGPQIVNDFGVGAQYSGPCPPANVKPFFHKYVFTVYALDIELNLPSSTNFPANAETLYHALISAGRAGHILQSASTAGFYSSTPPQ